MPCEQGRPPHDRVCYGRDYKGDIVTDIKVLKEGERCPKCGKPVIEHSRGIEVGQIFKLGTKYSESMKAFYKDENGNDCVYQMGCYGIGITCTCRQSSSSTTMKTELSGRFPLHRIT